MLKKLYKVNELVHVFRCTGKTSGLRQFLTIESPLKMKKNAFYFMLKALFILELFTFGYIGRRVDKTVMVNFKIYDFTNWTTNDYNNAQIIRYLKK